MIKNCHNCKHLDVPGDSACFTCVIVITDDVPNRPSNLMFKDEKGPSNWMPKDEPTEDTEDTDDQKAKADAGKPKLTLVPTQIIYDIAEVREYGNNKYPDGGPDNWKRVEAQRYRDAAFRHFLKYIKDPESIDPESGIKHRKHLECNLAFLAEMEDGE